MKPPRSAAELESELADTRRRLAEAEATLEAIRAGKVDALIITDNRGQEEVRNILNMGSLANSMFNLVTPLLPCGRQSGGNRLGRRIGRHRDADGHHHPQAGGNPTGGA